MMRNGEDEAGEPLSAEDIFMEQLDASPQAARVMVTQLVRELELYADIKLHYKFVAPADLRVRCLDKSNGRNVFVLKWKPTLSLFVCDSYATPEECRVLGAKCVEPASPPLKSTTRVPVTDHVPSDLLLLIVRQSIASYRARRAITN